MPILHWLNDDEARKTAGQVPYRLLEADKELSFGEPNAENMLIQGDNLEALKALLPYYAGQVKCIYIDPPYNTQSAFEHYDDNLEHSTWLSMLYPRLELLREFLDKEGTIWISIDDNECHYLKMIMDEIFGRNNFLTTFIWKKSYGGGSKARYFVGMHEYLLCYAKNIEFLPFFFLPPDKHAAGKYYKYRDDKFSIRGPYRLQPLATTSMDDRPNLRYPITLESGEEIWPDKQWQWSKERVLKAIADNEIVINRKKGKTTVSYKQYLRDEKGEERGRKPSSIIEGHYTQHGTYESINLFGLANKFAFPKPEGLVKLVLDICTKPGDLFLDSFLGSGTSTSVAHKLGRRYIGIEMGDHAVTHCAPRLKKVIEGEQGGISKTIDWRGGGGFTFYRLGETVFDEQGKINPRVKFKPLAAHVWFSETHTPLLFTPQTPLLGVHGETAFYLLYNGILGDKTPEGGNVLTARVLRELPEHKGKKVIYGEMCMLDEATLLKHEITFKHIPYDIKAR